MLKKDLPELPEARRSRFAEEFGLTMTEAEQLTASPELADYFEATARASSDGRAAYNWVMGEVMATRVTATFPVRPADLAQLIDLVKQGMVSHTAAKTVFGLMVETGKPPAQIAADEGLVKVGDDAALEGWMDEVLRENPAEAERFLGGEKKLQGVLVGLVMKKSKGRADPKRVNQLLASRAG